MKKLSCMLLVITMLVLCFSPIASATNVSVLSNKAQNSTTNMSSNTLAKENTSTGAETSTATNQPLCSITPIVNTTPKLEMRVMLPTFYNFNGSEKVNEWLYSNTANSIGEINRTALDLAEVSNNLKAGLYTDFNYWYNDNLLSVLTLNYNYSGGAHGMTWYDTLTVNMDTGEVYKLSSLFKEGSDYRKILIDNILAEIDKDPTLYFDDAKETVKNTKDFNFYLDGNNLVIYYTLYELRPYAGGIPVYTLSADKLKSVLKDDVYKALSSSPKASSIKLNGTDFNVSEGTFVTKDYTLMLPFRTIAEKLGYTVTWDAKLGTTVSGGNLTAPRKIDIKKDGGIYKNNKLFLPLNFFTDTLKENITYDGSIIRIYTVDKSPDSYRKIAQDNFAKQIVNFTDTRSDSDCVKNFAEANKNRQGAIQFGLYNEKLRLENFDPLSQMYWVTGTSSPSITSYDIKKTGENAYTVTYHWSLTGDKVPDSQVNVKIEQFGEYYRIFSISYN